MTKNKIRITEKTISEHIDKDYRTYSLHTIEKRGIPDFYDSLTNVQRYIIKNTTLDKIETLNVIGKCKSDGYAHGDSSLDGAVNKMARKFYNSDNIVEGIGFFGNPINQEGASARYTKIKMNRKFYDILKKYEDLNVKEEERYVNFKMEYPIGLVSHIMGIAVAYNTNILPRRLEDIIDYIENGKNEVCPYFMNYEGSIVQGDNPKTWYIKPLIEMQSKNKECTFTIKDISPTLSYESIIEKLNKNILEKYNPRVINKTNTKIDIVLVFNKEKLKKDEDVQIYDILTQTYTVKFTEVISYIRDGWVYTYDKLTDYLDDFKDYTFYLKRDKLDYDIKCDLKESLYLKAKIEYMEYMQDDKKTQKEIENFLSGYDSWIVDRLDNIKLRHLSLETLNSTKKEKENLENDILKKQQRLEKTNRSLFKREYIRKGKIG